MNSFSRISTLFKREMTAYFTSPLAYVFIVIFLLLSGFFTFASPPFGNFFAGGEASLTYSFFVFQPWIYMVLMPAVAMRLWSEEQKTGTVELLFTMPVSLAEAVIGKFLAAWAVLVCALAMTFPLVITVNILGSPDNGVIAAGYAACVMLSAGYLAIGCLSSAMTKNQVISFILSVLACLLLLLAGHQSVTDFFSGWAGEDATNMIAGLSVLPHFYNMSKGVMDIRDIVYFGSMTAFGLFATAVTLQSRRRAWN